MKNSETEARKKDNSNKIEYSSFNKLSRLKPAIKKIK